MTILSVARRRTNGELLAEVHELGYIRDTDRVLDPTYEKGLWWTEYRPPLLTHRSRADEPDFDFRSTFYPNASFDVVAFDPPYVAKGGRATSGIKDMDRRYGQVDCPPTPELLQALIEDGMTEMVRVLVPRGILLVKCKDYISSGKLFEGTYKVRQHAEKLDLTCVDKLVMVTGAGPQPERKRQVHSRNNSSTLYVFRTPR